MLILRRNVQAKEDSMLSISFSFWAVFFFGEGRPSTHLIRKVSLSVILQVITKESLLAAQVKGKKNFFYFFDGRSFLQTCILLSSGNWCYERGGLFMQREDLRRVMDLLSLREHHARTLLIHYRWDVEKLLAVLVEKGKASLFAEAGVTVKEDANSSPPFSSTVMCEICMEDVSGDKATKMDCGHCFCNDCKHHDDYLGFLL